MKAPFHLAIGVSDLNKARKFYKSVMGATERRSDTLWVDFDFFGHQLTCHLIQDSGTSVYTNPVDRQLVPIPHFGVIVPGKNFEEIAKTIKRSQIDFILKPQVRFKNRPGEQRTMFFKDPFGHCIEIKSYKGQSEY